MNKVAHLISKFTKNLVGTSQTADAYYNKGTAKIDRRDYAGAIADFTKAIEINPKDAGAYNKRAEAKGALCDHEGASADFKAAIKIDNSHAGFWGISSALGEKRHKAYFCWPNFSTPELVLIVF